MVEIDRFYLDAIITKRVVRKLRGGKTIFASVIKIKGMDSNQNITIDSPMKIKKLIEETDNGLLVEVEMIDSNGRLYTTQKFILKEFLRDPFGLTAAKIVERTDSGFVIGINTIYERRVGFLSFERAIENGFLPKNPTAQDYSALEGLFFSALEDQNDYINAAKNKIISNSFDMEQQYGSLQNLLTKVLIPGINVRIENPEFEFIFLAANSNREKISLDELNLLPTTSEEAWLAEQGYKDGFIGGLEETNERIAVRRRLQELKANPRKTHVEYFAKLILDYIAHIRQGLVDNYLPASKWLVSKSDQLQKLKILEEKAKKAISDREVTYELLLKFSKILSSVMEGGYVHMDPATFYDTEITDDLVFFL